MSVEAIARLSTPKAISGWRTLDRRFVAIYLVIYAFPYLIGFPAWSPLVDLAWGVKRAMLFFVVAKVLHLPLAVLDRDAVFNALMVATLALPALAASLAWTGARQQPTAADGKFQRGVEVYLRYMLASTMLLYGFQKVFPAQFPAPSVSTLAHPVGALSPMRLLWLTMGSSRSYQLFGAVCELGGAFLLFFRRTTTLGALVLCGVLANVAMLNYAYGVPVLFEASHLLFIAGYLGWVDLPALMQALILGRTTTLANRAALGPDHGARLGLKLAFVGIAVFMNYRVSSPSGSGRAAPSSTLAGVYEVEDFMGPTPDNFSPDAEHWRRLTVAGDGTSATLKMEDGSSHSYDLAVAGAQLTMSDDQAKLEPMTLDLAAPDPDHLLLRGQHGTRVSIRLLKFNPGASRLMGGR